MVCFFISLLKRKLPQRCPKQGGGEGGQGHFWTMSKRKQLFFRITSLRALLHFLQLCWLFGFCLLPSTLEDKYQKPLPLVQAGVWLRPNVDH